jgi:hypothetical protein
MHGVRGAAQQQQQQYTRWHKRRERERERNMIVSWQTVIGLMLRSGVCLLGCETTRAVSCVKHSASYMGSLHPHAYMYNICDHN